MFADMMVKVALGDIDERLKIRDELLKDGRFSHD